jgi:hypothetical protein
MILYALLGLIITLSCHTVPNLLFNTASSNETVLQYLQESFYYGLTGEELVHAHDYNFDHPGRIHPSTRIIFFVLVLVLVLVPRVLHWICRAVPFVRFQMHLIQSYFSLVYKTRNVAKLLTSPSTTSRHTRVSRMQERFRFKFSAIHNLTCLVNWLFLDPDQIYRTMNTTFHF